MSATILLEDLLLPACGGDGGYQTRGDIITATTDGIDLNAMWEEAQAVLSFYNQHEQALVSLLSFPVQNLVENVPQVGELAFEEASEFGEPKAGKLPLSFIQLGYDFRWYDVANRYTWKFLADADQRQIQAVHNEYLRADGRLIFRKVMEAIWDNRNRNAIIREQAYNVYPMYNADGMVPPPYGDETFDGTHNHYLVSNAAQVDPGDLEAAQDHIEEHGYSLVNGTRIVHMVNKAQAQVIRTFKAGVATGGVTAAYDFIPAPGQPTMILPSNEGLLGSQPPNVWNGLKVMGSYGDCLIIEDLNIPAGYMFTFGSGGLGNLGNLVGLREHANPAYRGLRLLPGNQQAYPLIDSYYSRGFGTGVRQRGGAVITQFKVGAANSYEIPARYKKTAGVTL